MNLLGRWIIEVAEKHPLPAANDLPSIRDVGTTSAFHKADTGEMDSSDDVAGPGFVKFIFVAASRSDLEAHLKELKPPFECYGRDNLAWKPYYPKEGRSVGPIVQAIAGEEGFESERVYPLSSGLMEHVEQAVRENKVVAVVVDPWTLQAPLYDQFIGELDAHESTNLIVLIPWKTEVPDTPEKRQAMQSTVQRKFFMKTNVNRNEKRFLDQVSSIDELDKQLRIGLQGAKMWTLRRLHAQGGWRAGLSRPFPGVSGP